MRVEKKGCLDVEDKHLLSCISIEGTETQCSYRVCISTLMLILIKFNGLKQKKRKENSSFEGFNGFLTSPSK